jgi:class 3 adenylate cyclase/tetratricopeptide (TPR) repeat protein
VASGPVAPAGTASPAWGRPPTPTAAGAGAGAGSGAGAGPGAELKLVSVLFADLVGFTTASEQRDAEQVRDTLTRYFERATTVVERYGGTIEKFIGDAVMAVWGTPVAFEDDAERAVRAALDLVEAVATLSTEGGGPELRLRAAVMTGEAAVTLGARNQGLVAGDLVNAASRLQALAEPGSVLVDDATAQGSSGAVAFEAAGEQLLRGRAAPVVAHRALRIVGKRGGVGRSQALEAPFVGRDAELRLVRDLYHATANESRARLISIVGQAGIGKSRLVWEFSKYTDGLAENLWWHEGRSPAYGEGVTFWALGEMIRQRAGILEGEDAETTRAKLSAAMVEYVPEEADRRWIEPALRQLLGVHDGAPQEREELFAAWRTFFERLAARSPTVLIFQDLHWADSGLLDFIEHLIEWSRSLPIYVVTMARPELLERRPTWGAAQRSFTSISLEPLAAATMGQLLDGLIPGLPAPVAQAIVERAEGVPLYAVETVRMLLHEGRLELVDGSYRTVGDLSRIEVPDSLQALISARLDALDPGDRSILQDAAVLGQSFSVAALSAVSGQDAVTLEPRLRSLVRREALALDSDPRSPERGQYGFVQALIREVAYGMLAKRERRSRHVAAARYYEALGDDELAGILARHYLDAYHASPEGPESDALAAQARVALRAAAERAVSLGSTEQAMTYYEQALAVAADDRERAELHERIGFTSVASGGVEKAERELTDAADRYLALGARLDRARVHDELARLLGNSGAFSTAGRMLKDSIAEIEDLSDTPEWVALNIGLGRNIAETQPEEALALLDRSLATAEHLNLVKLVVNGLLSRTGALILLQRTHEARALITGAQGLAMLHGHTRELLRAYALQTFMEAYSDPRSGLAAGQAGIELATRLGNRRAILDILGNAARCAIRTGDWQWVTTAIDEALERGVEASNETELTDIHTLIRALRGEDVQSELERIGTLVSGFDDPQSVAWHELTSAWSALADGRFMEALTTAERAAAASPYYAPEALPLAGRAALWSGDASRLRAAIDALDETGAHGLAIDADRLAMRAGEAALAGDRSTAVRLYREAIGRFGDGALAWDVALCQMDFHAAIRGEPDAAEQLAAASGTFQRLGAAAMTKLVDSIDGPSPSAGADPPFEPSTALTAERAIG